LRDLTLEGDKPVRDWQGGVRYNAHLGFWGMAPDNTLPAYSLAAECSFPACIVNPRVTADGVFVCLHDDGIDRVARFHDGKVLTPPNYFEGLTYADLQNYEFGSWKNEIYKGAHIPLLEDFFKLCSKTGMRPMFSTHPALSVEEWLRVKEMLTRYNILHLFHVKSFEEDILKTAYSVFGEDIDGYTLDIGWWTEDSLERILSVGIDYSKCRVGAEVLFDQYTEDIVQKIKKAGLFASVWDAKRRDFDEYERLISWGVSEFTEDHHCSMGLDF
jgi:glycerophosphoryl diester phosphodiesterase